MHVEFRTVSVSFDRTRGNNQDQDITFTFTDTVHDFGLAINGFTVRFNGQERPLNSLKVDVLRGFTKTGPTVTGKVRLRMRDINNDDENSGEVDVLCIANVV